MTALKKQKSTKNKLKIMYRIIAFQCNQDAMAKVPEINKPVHSSLEVVTEVKDLTDETMPKELFIQIDCMRNGDASTIELNQEYNIFIFKY